jgi:hypothetical protein
MLMTVNIYPEIITILSAEIVFLLVRSSDLLIWLKSIKQRTRLEQIRIDRGLGRSILIEAFVFVPSSAVLLMLLSPLLISAQLTTQGAPMSAINALIGVVSYGFPFATVRRVVTVIALNTLREFANIIPREITMEHNRPGGDQL